MGTNKFSVKMLKSDKKQSVFFIIAIALAVTLLFNIFNIIYNNNIVEFQKENMTMFNLIAILLMGVAAYQAFFASTFFLLSKTKELGVAAASGASTFRLAKIILNQTFILMFIAVIIGLGIGIVVSPIFLGAMFKSANITGGVISISKQGMIMTVVMIVIICAYIVLYNCGYAFRTEAIDLITTKKNISIPDTRMLKLPKTIYIVIFFVPIFLPLVNFQTAGEAILVCALMIMVTYGTQGVIRYYIPHKILSLKKEYFFNDKIKLISLSNVYYALRKSTPLILMVAISSTLFITLIVFNGEVKSVQLVCIFTYVLITILLAISIIYKVLIETYNRRGSFVQLKLIGYSRQQIKKIILEEIVMFNILIIGAPLFHIIILLITFIKSNIITIQLAVTLLSIFVGAYILSGIASFLGYKKMIINHLYGGK